MKLGGGDADAISVRTVLLAASVLVLLVVAVALIW
jgi:hypothetical protein